MSAMIEEKIAETLVESLLADCVVSVFDGEETTVSRSKDKKEILDALKSADSDTLKVYRPHGARVGFFWLIWGNGPDLISDYGPAKSGNYEENNAYVERVLRSVEFKLGL